MLRKISLCLILFMLVAIAGCKKKVPQNALKGYWCKRYTGTIAGQPVVVSIFCDGDNTARGTYYYVNKSEILYLSLSNDSANAGHVLVEESLITDRESEIESVDEDSEMTNFWDVVFDADSVSGKFHKDKGAPVYEISLHEDYAGAYPFSYARFDDSVSIKNGKWGGDAMGSCLGIIPAAEVNKEDAAFITDGIRRLLSFGDTGRMAAQKAGGKDYQKAFVHEYLEGFKRDIKEWQDDSLAPEPMGRYEQFADIIPLYNSNGILVIGNQWYDYSGGAHGNHGSSYVNMDVKAKKIWQLADIIQIDSVAISRLLIAEARAKFKMKADAPIEDVFFAKSIPANNNFIVGDRGLTFCYNPYDIASYADGEIMLFVPYNKMKSLIRPEFITRMGLKL